MIYLFSDPFRVHQSIVRLITSCSSISWAGPGAYDPKVNSVLMGIPRWKAVDGLRVEEAEVAW